MIFLTFFLVVKIKIYIYIYISARKKLIFLTLKTHSTPVISTVIEFDLSVTFRNDFFKKFYLTSKKLKKIKFKSDR